MTQFIVTHIDGNTLNLHSRAKGTYVESAKFRPRWQSYAELTLEIIAYEAPEWAYFDRIVVDDTPVFLHEWNEAQHIDNKGTKYILHFYGIEKMLFEASPFLDIDSAGAYISKDKPPIVGNLELFGNVLCNCINYRAYNTATGQRYKQDTIKLGTCQAGTKHLLVSTTEYNAFAALLAVCSAFKTHYTITTNPEGDTDYLLNFGVAPGVYAPLAYGRGKGLYKLDRKSINNENVKTILTVLGSSKNLPQGYGKQRLELDETQYPGSVIADNSKIQTFGAWNDIYINEDIMPSFRGEIVSTVPGDIFSFISGINDFNPSGGTLNMLTGGLAGSNFRIAAFDEATGKITVEELTDNSGLKFPSVAPYLFATGDTFTIVDIPMPQAYVEIAQQALAEAGQARYLEISQPRVAYNVALHSRFVKSHGSRPKVGMYFPITDARYGVNKAIQCVTLERNLLAQDEYEYTNCEVADNVVETLGAKIYKQSKEAQALLKHLGATHLTTPTSSLQGAVRTAQAAAEAVAALEAEAARIAAEAYADGILSAEEAARIADVAAKLTEAKQYATAQAAAAEAAAKTYAEAQAAAAQAAAEAVAEAEAESAEISAKAYADGVVSAEEARAIAEAAAKLTEAKNYAESQAAAAESAASTYAAAQAEAARLASIASAKTYTDTEVTAAKGYADSTAAAAQSAAEAYALAKANLAETNAEAYADGIVDAEEAARIAEATAKLNEAKTYAETKATAAETAAKAYADTQLGNFATTVTGSLSDLQNQIDGSITTHFYAYVPTTANAPASGWTTTALKNQHLGDLFYNTATGFCYRYQLVSSVYSWQRITDSDVTKALADAAAAQDTADSKRRVFVATPVTPYDIGDLWLKSGDLYKCKVTRLTGSYVASDWEKGVKYTDDTVANANLVTAKAYADTKKAEAIAAAEDYAEAEALAAKTAAEAYADGQITAEEAARIADVNAKLNTAKTYAETKASEAQTAAQQYAATAASNAQSAAQTYALSKANLAETTAKAYADGIVDAEEARAIADATAKANAAKAAAEATAAALDDAIQVGGRNLLLNSTYANRIPLYLMTATVTNIEDLTLPSKQKMVYSNVVKDSSSYCFYLPTNNSKSYFSVSMFGKPFVWSFYMKANVPQTLVYNSGESTITTEWKRIEIPFHINNGNVHTKLFGEGLTTFEVSSIKVELGNKATDWTPAPEDVQAEIDAADAAAAAAQSTANTAQTAADNAATAAANAVTTAASDATTKMNAAKDAIAQEAGYTNFADMASKAALTVNGLLNSQIINVDDLFANTAFVAKLVALSAFIENLIVKRLVTANDGLGAYVEIQNPTIASPVASINLRSSDGEANHGFIKIYVEDNAETGVNATLSVVKHSQDSARGAKTTPDGILLFTNSGVSQPATAKYYQVFHDEHGFYFRYKVASDGVWTEYFRLTWDSDGLMFKLAGLQTTNPGTDRVWKDSHGYLKIGDGAAYAEQSHNHTKSQITDFPSSMPASDVSAWAKAASKPSYSASEVGALPTNTIQYFTQAQWNALSQAQKDAVPLALVQE